MSGEILQVSQGLFGGGKTFFSLSRYPPSKLIEINVKRLFSPSWHTEEGTEAINLEPRSEAAFGRGRFEVVVGCWDLEETECVCFRGLLGMQS